MKAPRPRAVAVVVLAAALAVLLPLPLPAARPAGGLHSLSEEVREHVLTRYVQPVDEEALTWGAVGGLAARDRNSTFMSPRETKAFLEETRGEFQGIGVYVELVDGILTVTAPLEGSPAEAAGILPGDRILAVNGVSIQGLRTAEEGTRLVKGKAGTPVVLQVLHEEAEEPVDITVIRQAIQVRSVRGARILEGEPAVAYLRVSQFQPSTVDEFDKAMEELLARQPVGLVLDLRFNPGGLLGWNHDEDGNLAWAGGVGLADRFIREGVLVSVRGRNPAEDKSYQATGERTLPDTLRVAVLVNGSSASASEIVAGAIHDTRRGLLVGERSYGKGSVQSVIAVPVATREGVEDAELKLTTALYYTPSDRCIHREDGMTEDDPWGLMPDVPVSTTAEERLEILRARRAQDVQREDGAVADKALAEAVALLRNEARYRELLK